MKVFRLVRQGKAETRPLTQCDLDPPVPGDSEVLVRVLSCGVCRTDLHIVEGDLALPTLPIIPGHQIVGIVERTGGRIRTPQTGATVGVPWLSSVCGNCRYCTSERENLCESGKFTGFHINGGFAEHVVVPGDSAYPLPPGIEPRKAAPLLCAGVIGYRALRLSGAQPGMTVSLHGFGASAHITLQVLKHLGCDVHVFTRGDQHAELARSLGASWTGSAGKLPPRKSDCAIVFAPAGEVVHAALKNVDKGGTVALAGIHMTPIPEMSYDLIYGERMLRSAANSTRADVRELLDLASKIPIETEVEIFPVDEVNEVLLKLKKSELRASGVLAVAS